MTALPNESVNNNSTDSGGPNTLASLPDAQVFSRDPEDYTTENLADTIRRLRRIMERQRKARQDDAEIAELTAKLKTANAAAKKTKATKAAKASPTKVKPLSMDTKL